MPEITQFVSSVDGETPVDTEPVELVWNDAKYRLYLTPEQWEDFNNEVAKVTAYEKPKPIVTPTKTKAKKSDAEVWANSLGFTRKEIKTIFDGLTPKQKSDWFGDTSIPDRARVSEEFKANFEQALQDGNIDKPS